MSNDLVVFENMLTAVKPQFADVLGGRMPPERLIRTVMLSVGRLPALLDCNRQSLMNAAMTAGVLGLECDGVTGQFYILPFKAVAQPVIGFKGYNTIAARAGLTITGDVVREGDEFDYAKGTKAFVYHKPSLTAGGRIIAAWSQAESKDRPPIVEILGIEELLAVKGRSPGAKRSDSPWNDERIGFPAMCAKTAKRRLARSTPMNWAAPEFQYAASMEEAFEERGRPSYIAPGKGVIVDGEVIATRSTADDTPNAEDLVGRGDNAEVAALKVEGQEAAEIGTDMVKKWWGRLSPRHRVELREWKDDVLKPLAEKADKEGAGL